MNKKMLHDKVSCQNCENSLGMGDGNLYCYEERCLVMENYVPSENFLKCGGEKFKEEI